MECQACAVIGARRCDACRLRDLTAANARMSRQIKTARAALEQLANDPSAPKLGQFDWKHIAREALASLAKEGK